VIENVFIHVAIVTIDQPLIENWCTVLPKKWPCVLLLFVQLLCCSLRTTQQNQT